MEKLFLTSNEVADLLNISQCYKQIKSDCQEGKSNRCDL